MRLSALCAAVCPVLFGARGGKAEGTAAVLHPIHGLLRPGAVRLYGSSHSDPGAAGDPVSISANQKENEIPLRPVVRSRIGCVCSAVSALRTGAGGFAEGLQLPGAVHHGYGQLRQGQQHHHLWHCRDCRCCLSASILQPGRRAVQHLGAGFNAAPKRPLSHPQRQCKQLSLWPHSGGAAGTGGAAAVFVAQEAPQGRYGLCQNHHRPCGDRQLFRRLFGVRHCGQLRLQRHVPLRSLLSAAAYFGRLWGVLAAGELFLPGGAPPAGRAGRRVPGTHRLCLWQLCHPQQCPVRQKL